MVSNCIQNDVTIRFRLEKVLEHCNQMISDLGNMSFVEFKKNDLLARATAFTLTNTCEQITKLKPRLEKEFPTLPWKTIANFRIVLTHIYWEIDYQIMYDVIMYDLPKLKEEIQNLLKIIIERNIN